MIMPLPKISVVIPTRHRDQSLAKCLACLAAGTQSLDSAAYEVIVTDDGTAGTTEGFLRSQFPWVRYFAGPRRGPAANRNNGARHAQYDFVAFTDDDCLPSPDWLSAFANAVQDGVAVYEGKTTCEAGIHSPTEQAPINLHGGQLWSCNMMVRAEVFWSCGGFDEDFPYATMEDMAFRETLQAAGVKSQFVPGACVDHPPRPHQLYWALAPHHESIAIYWSKFPERAQSLPRHMFQTARYRFSRILHERWSTDSLRALGSALFEQALVATQMPRWRRRYAARIRPRNLSPG